MTLVMNIMLLKYAESKCTSFFLWKISKMSIKRLGETTVEFATHSQKRLFFYINLNVLGNFMLSCQGSGTRFRSGAE